MRILLVDDDPAIRDWVQMVLQEDRYQVDAAKDAQAGRALALSITYDLAILDLDLPDRSGLGLVFAMREAGRRHPIIILTGTELEESIIAALDAGADDYLIKPVSGGLLRARVRAALRRGGSAGPSAVQVGNVRVDPLARRIMVDRSAMNVTPREYDLLTYLLQRPGEAIGRAELLERVWHMQFDTQTNVIDATVSRLRARLREAGASVTIDAVRGRGYALSANE